MSEFLKIAKNGQWSLYKARVEADLTGKQKKEVRAKRKVEAESTKVLSEPGSYKVPSDKPRRRTLDKPPKERHDYWTKLLDEKPGRKGWVFESPKKQAKRRAYRQHRERRKAEARVKTAKQRSPQTKAALTHVRDKIKR